MRENFKRKNWVNFDLCRTSCIVYMLCGIFFVGGDKLRRRGEDRCLVYLFRDYISRHLKFQFLSFKSLFRAIMLKHKIGNFDEFCGELFYLNIIIDDKIHNHLSSASTAAHCREWNFYLISSSSLTDGSIIMMNLTYLRDMFELSS